MGNLYHQAPTLPAEGSQTGKWELFSMVWEVGGAAFLMAPIPWSLCIMIWLIA